MINANICAPQRLHGASPADGGDASRNNAAQEATDKETDRDATRRLRQFEIPHIAQEADDEEENNGTTEEG